MSLSARMLLAYAQAVREQSRPTLAYSDANALRVLAAALIGAGA